MVFHYALNKLCVIIIIIIIILLLLLLLLNVSLLVSSIVLKEICQDAPSFYCLE